MSEKHSKIAELEARCKLYESWLRALDEYVNFDIWFKSDTSHYLYVNKQFEHAMGMSRDQLLGKSPADIFDNEERQQRVYALDKRIMDDGYMHRVVPCDGSGYLQVHEERRFPVHDEDGNISGLGCVAIEVSQRSFTEEALTQAQTIAQLGDWRWSIKEKCLISCSDQFAELLGSNTKDVFALMQHRLERVVHPDDRSIVQAIMDRSTPGEHLPYQIEYRILRPNGEVRYVVEIAQPLIGNEGIAVEYAGILQDITGQKKIETELRDAKEKLEARVLERTRHLEFLASHDSLTGLLNRSAYYDSFNDRIKKNKTTKNVTLIVLDLDGFKLVNDSHGHLAGDTVLKTVALRLNQAVKEDDIIVRLGGDEFAVILFDIVQPNKNAKKICERLRTVICDPISIDNIAVRVGCSFGISFLPHQKNDKESLEQAIANADIALYKSKITKGVHCSTFEEQMGQEVAQRQRLENDFRKALAERQLSVVYQPQISMVTRELVGIEALARWQHPELGAITPDVFIPIAEDCGLINELSEIVLQTACEDLSRLLTVCEHSNIKVAVNFSVAQFYNENLLTSIEAILKNNALTPAQLEIEVTESLFIKNPEYTKSLLKQMRTMGFSVSLDDFGTGYSALGYLQEFEVDTIKLDRSFVKTITHQESNLKIVEGIIKLAKSIDLAIVAEGVEYHEQDKILKELGCDIVQGYLHGRPMAIEQVMGYVRPQKIPQGL